MMIVVTEGMWQMAIGDGDAGGPLVPAGSGKHVLDDMQHPGVAATIRAWVELQGRAGGMAPVAYVGGELGPGGSELEVQGTGPMTIGAPRNFRSPLGRELVAGLPDEFVGGVVEGFIAVPCRHVLQAGTVRLDRAAYDGVDSSPRAFARASGLLRCALASLAVGVELDGAEFRLLARSWR